MQPTFLNGKLITIWICIKQRTPTGPLFMSREIGKRVMVQWSEIVWEETVSA